MNPAIPEHATVVTASDRLARHLRDRAADAQLAAGRQAWERPDILPVGAFWRRLAIELQQDAALPLASRRLLSRPATLCRWEAFIAESFADNPLLQTAGAARTALDAWQLCREWRLDIDALAADPLEETRLLVEWGRRFETECADNGWLPDYALPEAVLAALEQSDVARQQLPGRIRLAGFLEITPLDDLRWNALRALGATVDAFPQTAPDPDVRCLPCDDARSEVLAAASWARARLQENALQRIGIVVPDLAQRRTLLKRELTDALVPRRLVAFGEGPLPFNFSLGEPLASVALVADAQAVLSLAGNRTEFAVAARLVRSPYLGTESEAVARLGLEAVMRREGYAEFTLGDWRFLAEREHCSGLADAIDRFRAEVSESSADALPSEWARRFSRWLEAFGWCRGRTLDSNEYQAREAWNDLLARLVELDVVLGPCNRATAIGWLNRFATDTPFQPRAADAPVQVLGLLEATGMQFDALWVMGLTDETLPAAPRPNPFLPIAVQRAKNLPQSSAKREQAFAQQLFEGLCRAAPEVTLSYPVRDKDAELARSPLLDGCDAAERHAPFPPVAGQWFGATLETVVDVRGPRHPGGETKGGTALLQNQSHCPFRAFAIHRLHANDWPTPQPGPDAMLRGLLAHRVLEALWSRWRTRSRLEELHANGELEDTVRATVAAVLADSLPGQRHRWRTSLRDIEVTRLTNVLLRWFGNVELPRPAFHVAEVEGLCPDGTEVKTRVSAGPLILGGKLDRVDVLHDGSELIIDYKTGEAPGKNDFFGERPRAPQLPAYLLARLQQGKQVPSAIAVASLKTGHESLQGVMRVDGDDGNGPGIAGLVNVAKTRQVSDWNDAVAHWERVINALGEAFAAGEARVDPLRGACDYCHLATLCRIHDDAETAEDGHD